MDDVIFEEFKGTGNSESSSTASSSTSAPSRPSTSSAPAQRKEELLIPKEDLQRIWSAQSAKPLSRRAMELLIERLAKAEVKRVLS